MNSFAAVSSASAFARTQTPHRVTRQPRVIASAAVPAARRAAVFGDNKVQLSSFRAGRPVTMPAKKTVAAAAATDGAPLSKWDSSRWITGNQIMRWRNYCVNLSGRESSDPNTCSLFPTPVDASPPVSGFTPNNAALRLAVVVAAVAAASQGSKFVASQVRRCTAPPHSARAACRPLCAAPSPSLLQSSTAVPPGHHCTCSRRVSS